MHGDQSVGKLKIPKPTTSGPPDTRHPPLCVPGPTKHAAAAAAAAATVVALLLARSALPWVVRAKTGSIITRGIKR